MALFYVFLKGLHQVGELVVKEQFMLEIFVVVRPLIMLFFFLGFGDAIVGETEKAPFICDRTPSQRKVCNVENNTWCTEIPDLFRGLNMISHE